MQRRPAAPRPGDTCPRGCACGACWCLACRPCRAALAAYVRALTARRIAAARRFEEHGPAFPPGWLSAPRAKEVPAR
jgi:hypothetical protein